MTARPRRRRGSLLFPLALTAAGIVLLLSNLGMIEGDVWLQLVRWWPVLIIALGLDVLLGRPSFGAVVGSAVFALLLVAAGVVLFQLFGPAAWRTRDHAVSYPSDGIGSAEIVLSCGRCSVQIEDPAAVGHLIDGNVSVGADTRLHQTTSAVAPGGGASYELTTEPRSTLLLRASRDELPWILRLSEVLPLALRVTADGAVTIDLRPFLVTELDLTAGESPCELWLPARIDSEIYVSGEELLLRVPDGVGVRIAGSAEIVTASAYSRIGDEIRSDDFETAPVRASIFLRPGAGRVRAEPAPEEPDQEPAAI